jgi:hypothetical protein
MKLEVPIKVDIDDVTELIHDLQCLQTYKLGVNETTVLVSLDAVADVFADHIRAKRLDEDIDVPTKEEVITVDWIESYLSNCAVGSIVYFVIEQMLYKWREEQEGEQHETD